MHLNDVTLLAHQGESQTVEFKKSTAEKDRACRTLCAFANSQGDEQGWNQGSACREAAINASHA